MSRIRLCMCLMGILIFSGLIANCTSGPKKWYRSGATAQDFETDRQTCENAILTTGTTGFSVSTYSFEGCMEQKGWTILDSPS